MSLKPYMIIEGSSAGIDTFEKKVAEALDLGYCLAGELVTHATPNEIKFFQTVMSADLDEDEEDDDEYEDEDEDAEDAN